MSTTTLKGWIGVDLDGTLAHYDNWETHGENIGDIITPMKDRVIEWLGKNIEVRILTARAINGPSEIKKIQDWLEKWGLPRLMVTACKDFGMIELWDDRAIGVISNTGLISISEEL